MQEEMEFLGKYKGFAFYADKDYIFREDGTSRKRIQIGMLPDTPEIRKKLETYWSETDNTADGSHYEFFDIN